MISSEQKIVIREFLEEAKLWLELRLSLRFARSHRSQSYHVADIYRIHVTGFSMGNAAFPTPILSTSCVSHLITQVVTAQFHARALRHAHADLRWRR
jgi:hypothetical protein